MVTQDQRSVSGTQMLMAKSRMQTEEGVVSRPVKWCGGIFQNASTSSQDETGASRQAVAVAGVALPVVFQRSPSPGRVSMLEKWL